MYVCANSDTPPPFLQIVVLRVFLKRQKRDRFLFFFVCSKNDRTVFRKKKRLVTTNEPLVSNFSTTIVFENYFVNKSEI